MRRLAKRKRPNDLPPLVQYVSAEFRHGVLGAHRIGLGLCLFGSTKVFLFTQVEQDVDRRHGEQDFVDEKGAWVGQESDSLGVNAGRSHQTLLVRAADRLPLDSPWVNPIRPSVPFRGWPGGTPRAG